MLCVSLYFACFLALCMCLGSNRGPPVSRCHYHVVDYSRLEATDDKRLFHEKVILIRILVSYVKLCIRCAAVMVGLPSVDFILLVDCKCSRL